MTTTINQSHFLQYIAVTFNTNIAIYPTFINADAYMYNNKINLWANKGIRFSIVPDSLKKTCRKFENKTVIELSDWLKPHT